MVRKRLVVYSQDLELAQADGVRSLEFVQGDAVVTFRTGSLGLAGDA